MPSKTFPKYRRQTNKSGDRAFVELNGRRIYLGEFGSKESRELYRRTVAEWEANGRQLGTDPNEITVTELSARYWSYAVEYYGEGSCEVAHLRRALKPVKALYGSTPAAAFGPRRLKTVRQQFVDQGLCRRTVNKTTERIRRIFKWAVAEELIPAATYHALQAVPGLKRGRTEARETEPVKPVPESDIHAIRPYLSRQVWALIELQMLTAARSGELVVMRPMDINTEGNVWFYSPESHKTAYRGHNRVIYIGPKAQDALRPFMIRPKTAFLFSPREAESERRERQHAERKTPLSCGNRPGTNRKRRPKREAQERYTVYSYARAITRACKRAAVPHWHPHQLRHNAATFLRKEFGLEISRIILGHRSAAITEVYAELDRAKAIDIISRIG